MTTYSRLTLKLLRQNPPLALLMLYLHGCVIHLQPSNQNGCSGWPNIQPVPIDLRINQLLEKLCRLQLRWITMCPIG